jgi:glycerate-2-kinase
VERVTIAAFGTDGIDGNSPAAGAIADGTTIARARLAGFDPRTVLAANDSFALFDRLGDVIVTGPTGTNVGDVFLAMIGP